MKIIGKTHEGLLISATEDEVANLIGFNSKYSDNVHKALSPGQDIKVSEMFHQLYTMATMKKDIEDAAAKLRMCADTLTLTAPIVDTITGTQA